MLYGWLLTFWIWSWEISFKLPEGWTQTFSEYLKNTWDANHKNMWNIYSVGYDAIHGNIWTISSVGYNSIHENTWNTSSVGCKFLQVLDTQANFQFLLQYNFFQW